MFRASLLRRYEHCQSINQSIWLMSIQNTHVFEKTILSGLFISAIPIVIIIFIDIYQDFCSYVRRTKISKKVLRNTVNFPVPIDRHRGRYKR